MISIRLPERGE